jgi:hypothetical protein
MKANAQEKAFYTQHALPGVPLAKAGLSEGALAGLGVHSAAGPTHLPGAGHGQRRRHVVAGPRRRKPGGSTSASAWDLTRDNSSVSQILAYVSRLIGVPMPAVYVPPTAPDEIDLVIVLGRQAGDSGFRAGRGTGDGPDRS